MLENSLTKDKIINEFQKKAKDTGSSEVQIALLTKRINSLTEHFKNNKKDNHSREGMIKLISRRRRLLGYLKKRDLKRYEEIIKKLNLRK
ncbi:MAG: 30S ribosomal protein S15 [Pelagibacteraceae bacterium]|nr:30S ribosomal protein S15 [Pelagibacteraceae bacterium]|tara:strand:+ start:23389 stop:23658 length:270 start_codon:yes stop_codon:yes gene_type:complete